MSAGTVVALGGWVFLAVMGRRAWVLDQRERRRAARRLTDDELRAASRHAYAGTRRWE